MYTGTHMSTYVHHIFGYIHILDDNEIMKCILCVCVYVCHSQQYFRNTDLN